MEFRAKRWKFGARGSHDHLNFETMPLALTTELAHELSLSRKLPFHNIQ